MTSDFKIKKYSKKVKLYQTLKRSPIGFMKYSGGHNYQYKEDCGDYSSFYSCECHKTIKIYKKACNRLDCPTCVYEVSQKHSIKISERMMGLKRFFKLKHLKHISFNCSSFSKEKGLYYAPNEAPYNKLDYDTLRKKLIDLLKTFNASGILIYHPYRISTLDPEEKKLGISGHFHFIGSVYLPNSKDFEKSYNFTYKNIRDLYNQDDIRKVANYLLTHCGFFASSSFWFGNFAYNNGLSCEKSRIEEYIQCEECKGYLYKCDPVIFEYIMDKLDYYILDDEILIDNLMGDKPLLKVSYYYTFFEKD